MANLVAEVQRKIVIDRGSDSETWKAVKGFRDDSSKDNGKSGCGVVIQRGRQGQTGHDQQGRGATESRYCHGSRNDGCVRAHGKS